MSTSTRTVVMDDTFYMNDERMDSLMYAQAKLCDDVNVRKYEYDECPTLTKDEDTGEMECQCEQKATNPGEYYPIHGNKYEGSLHLTAKRAFMNTKDEETEYGRELFEKGVAFLDRVEGEYTVGKAKPLAYGAYKACKKFRARLNLYRYELHVLTYEQWAYLTNWLNVLTSWKHLTGENKGEIKQYPCEKQNIQGKELTLEDIKYEIEQIYYSRD